MKLPLLCLVALSCSAQLGNPGTLARLKGASASASYPTGVANYWTFDGTLNDSVGGDNLIDEGVNDFPAGKHNDCVEFTDGGDVGSNNDYDTTAAFTLAVWVYVPTGADFHWDCGFDREVKVYISGGNWKAKGGTTATVLNGPSVNYDSWELVALTYDGTSGEHFSVNGATFIDGTVTVESPLAYMVFGPVSGLVRCDEAGWFTRALTQQEVSNIWNGGAGTFGP